MAESTIKRNIDPRIATSGVNLKEGMNFAMYSDHRMDIAFKKENYWRVLTIGNTGLSLVETTNNGQTFTTLWTK